jgi:hypothetical protein
MVLGRTGPSQLPRVAGGFLLGTHCSQNYTPCEGWGKLITQAPAEQSDMEIDAKSEKKK